MIRIATLEDSYKATKTLLNFYKSVNPPFKTSAAWALSLFETFVKDDDKIAIIKDGGILLGGVSKSLLGPFIQAYELVWWVDPDCRGNSLEMIRIYEDWAIEKGAKLIELKSLSKYKDTEKIYKKIGYTPIETSWVKITE